MTLIDIPEIDMNRCDGCGQCLPACSSGALGLYEGKVVFRPELCRWDGACELACPREAIRVPYLIVFSEDSEKLGAG